MKDIKVFLVIAIVVFSIFALITYSEHKKQEKFEEVVQDYNNFRFVKRSDMWWTDYKKGDVVYTIPFRYLPKEVENLSIGGNLTDFTMEKIKLTFSPEDNHNRFVALATAELTLSLKSVFRADVEVGCTKTNEELCPNLPVIDCNSSGSVVLLRIAQEPKVILDENCIIFEGNNTELVRGVDLFLYSIMGII